MQLPGSHLLDVIERPVHLFPGLLQVGQAPAKGNSLDLEPLGQLAPFLVQAPTEPGAAHLGVDAHLVAIEPVAGLLVATAIAIAGDFVPAMRAQRLGTVEPHSGAIADQLAVEQGDETSLAEIVQLAANLACLVTGHALISTPHQIGDRRNIGNLRLANFQPGAGQLR